MYELERPPHRVYDGPDQAKSERVRDLYRYWLSKCRDDALPARSAIDPAEVRGLLPYLILAELEAAPFVIRYRLVGTAVAKAHRDDFTGRAHDTVMSLIGAGLDDSYRRVEQARAPVFGHSGLDLGDRSWIGFEYAILPLSDDGRTVDRCLAMEVPDAFEAPTPSGDPPTATPDR